MSAMMAMLKTNKECHHTLSRVITEAQNALAAKHKFKKRARKLAKRLAKSQELVEESRGHANYHMTQWYNASQERDELLESIQNLTLENEEAGQEIDMLTRHRDAALKLAENRRMEIIRNNRHALEMQDYLNARIEEGLVEIHRLNNERDPIPHPALVYLDLGPQVIVAEDDGMEVDGPGVLEPAKAAEDDEEEEVKPVSDEDGEAIFDASSDDDA
jgi:rhamnose utilization protein RhaD (predicted bifunctional aldolase and dehydrogenase)